MAALSGANVASIGLPSGNGVPRRKLGPLDLNARREAAKEKRQFKVDMSQPLGFEVTPPSGFFRSDKGREDLGGARKRAVKPRGMGYGEWVAKQMEEQGIKGINRPRKLRDWSAAFKGVADMAQCPDEEEDSPRGQDYVQAERDNQRSANTSNRATPGTMMSHEKGIQQVQDNLDAPATPLRSSAKEAEAVEVTTTMATPQGEAAILENVQGEDDLQEKRFVQEEDAEDAAPEEGDGQPEGGVQEEYNVEGEHAVEGESDGQEVSSEDAVDAMDAVQEEGDHREGEVQEEDIVEGEHTSEEESDSQGESAEDAVAAVDAVEEEGDDEQEGDVRDKGDVEGEDAVQEVSDGQEASAEDAVDAVDAVQEEGDAQQKGDVQDKDDVHKEDDVQDESDVEEEGAVDAVQEESDAEEEGDSQEEGGIPEEDEVQEEQLQRVNRDVESIAAKLLIGVEEGNCTPTTTTSGLRNVKTSTTSRAASAKSAAKPSSAKSHQGVPIGTPSASHTKCLAVTPRALALQMSSNKPAAKGKFNRRSSDGPDEDSQEPSASDFYGDAAGDQEQGQNSVGRCRGAARRRTSISQGVLAPMASGGNLEKPSELVSPKNPPTVDHSKISVEGQGSSRRVKPTSRRRSKTADVPAVKDAMEHIEQAAMDLPVDKAENRCQGSPSSSLQRARPPTTLNNGDAAAMVAGRVFGRQAPKRKREHAGRSSLGGFGTVIEEGLRRSTRIRMRPLSYWLNEHAVYGRTHHSLPTIVRVQLQAPLPCWPRINREDEMRLTAELFPLNKECFPF